MSEPEGTTDLLQELVRAPAPPGREEAVLAVCRRELEAVCDTVDADAWGNLVGRLGPAQADRPGVRIVVHADEVAMIVKRVDPDGGLRVLRMGGVFPQTLGTGPVEVLGDRKTLSGVLSTGPMHVTRESARIWEHHPRGENRALDWQHVRVVTRKRPAQLADAGVHPGTRVVIARARRELFRFADCVAGYFLDDRAAVLAALRALHLLREGPGPRREVELMVTREEEPGTSSVKGAALRAPERETVAVDVAPAAAEYAIDLCARPVVVYGDKHGFYDPALAQALLEAGRAAGTDPQTAVLENYGSDASQAHLAGALARTGLVGIPTDNTHGYEVMVEAAIDHAARLLAAYAGGVHRATGPFIGPSGKPRGRGGH